MSNNSYIELNQLIQKLKENNKDNKFILSLKINNDEFKSETSLEILESLYINHGINVLQNLLLDLIKNHINDK